MISFFKKTLFVILVFYCVALLGLYFFQERFIFQSVKLNPNYSYNFTKSFKEINLKTKDGAILNAVYFKVEKPKGVILYFHGNKGNLQRWGKIASELTRFNYNVFVVDYRGYGKSTGKRSEIQLYADAQHCYDFLKQQFDESKIVVYGRSLGTTFATYIAGKDKPQQLILEAPFNHLSAVPKYWFKYVPYDLLLRYKFNSQEYIKTVSCPITIFHGTKDLVIPIKLGQQLFKSAPAKTTKFITVNKATHHNIGEFEVYKEKMRELLE